METAQWHQQGVERRMRPHKEKALKCPRCNSTNTKFCYYNNYSLRQPRYFCKSCRRYWTEGGSLRNVPIGGGSRKNKRFNSSSSSSSLPSYTTTTTTTKTTTAASSTSLLSSTSRRLISFEGPNSSKETQLSSNAWIKLHAFGMPNQGDFGIGELIWPSKMNIPLDYGVGTMEETKDSKQVTIRNVCDEFVEGSMDPTLFWDGVTGDGEGGW